MKKVSILMYHQIGDFKNPKSHRATFCHIRRFRAQMAYLHRLRYRVISLNQAVEGLFENRSLPGHSVVLTFDDGYQDFRDHAFPILQRYGFPATVFLVSSMIGKDAQWLAYEGRFAPKLMTAATVRDLLSKGVAFGSHTLTHPFLTRINPSVMAREISESKTELEDLLGEEIAFFSYPDGKYHSEAVRAVKAAGYRAALTCDRGSAIRSDDPLLLPRKAISFGDSLAGYFWKLHMKHKRKPVPN